MPSVDCVDSEAVQASRGEPSLRVLAAIELGGHWGHLLRIKPVLDALRERGHAGALATSDAASAGRLLAGEPVDIHACPSLRLTHPPPRGARYRHYAQILDLCAFGDDAVLASNVRQWIALIGRARPDVLLTDFSPLALFVAHLARLPAVQIPIGWEAPRHGEPLPMLPPAQDEDRAPYDALEATMLARLNRQCAAYRAPPLRRLSDIYAIGTQLLACWPQTDHFAPRAGARYVGPIYSDGHGAPVRWPAANRHRPRVFVYLAPGSREVAVLRALRNAEADVIAVMPGLTPHVAESLRTPRLQVVEGPVRIGDALPQARLVISNGGHGLIGASLRSGVPMLIVPRTAEQFMLARHLAGSGVAHVLAGASPDDLPALIMRMLRDEDSLGAAKALAAAHADRSLAQTLRDVVEAVERAGRPVAAQI